MRGRIASSVEPGARIGFLTDPNTPIILGSELTIPEGRSIFIDASNLSAPVTISGDNQFRVFNIPATATVAMHSVKITNGKAPDGAIGADNPDGVGGKGSPGANGGGVFNAGTLSLFSSSVTNNRSGRGGNGGAGDFGNGSGANGGDGGGIFSSGTLTLTACTVSGNSCGNGGDGGLSISGDGGNGGGIFSSRSLFLSACTLSGNASGSAGAGSFSGSFGAGGGIFSAGSLSLTSCTVSENTTGTGQASGDAGGGGIRATTASLQHCLIARNSSLAFNDLSASTITYLGGNLLGTAANVSGTGTTPIIDPNPLLAPLGDYGGPTQTMPPLPGSPAINAAPGSPRTTDQRGFPLFGVPDLGAAELQGFGPIPDLSTTEDTAVTSAPFAVGGIGVLLATSSDITLVTNTTNTGTGSLRQAIANAAINPGAETVTFAPGLSDTIVLTSEILITDTAGVTIDATALPVGLTLSGGTTTRHFQVQAGKTLTLRGLTLTAGRVTGEGGAVYNAGTLNLDRCTFSGNASTSNGGAIASIGTLSLTNCTLSGNSASGTGGGLFSNGTSTVLFSTISGNTAVEGGGISTLQTFHLTASIVAGNTGTTALPNIKGTLTTNAQNLATGDPLLAPLAGYGGLTFTMPPLPGSLAINAATGRTRTTDQRGFPSVGFPDIGATEFQGNTDLRRFWNTDWDGDGTHFGLEFALGTNPRLSDPASPNNLVLSAATNGNPVITFGRNPAANSTTTWRLTRSTTLLEGSFTEIFRFTGPTGTPTTTGSTVVTTATSFQVTDTTPPPGKAFYRIEAISP